MQELALYNAADDLGGESIIEITANVERVLEANAEPVHQAVYQLIVSSAKAGVATASDRLPFNMSLGVDWKLPNRNAENFALNYSYDLISQVQQTTKNGIRQALARWINEGGKLDDLADSIRPLIQNEPSTRMIEALFRTDRARMIAETEATRAYARGKVEGYMASGLSQQGPKKEPPAHVRCRCDVRPDSDADGAWWWVWLTSNDDRVCPICAPLHKQYVGLARPAPEPVAPNTPPLPPEAKPGTFEQSIVGLSKEMAAVYSPDGTLEYTKGGTTKRVRFTSGELPQLIGRVVIHNHPGGASFSEGDITAVWAAQMRELRAIGVNSNNEAWRHSVKPDAAFYLMQHDDLLSAIEASKAAITPKLAGLIQSGQMTREYANNQYWHYLWTDLDQRLSKKGIRLGYRRVPLYGN